MSQTGKPTPRPTRSNTDSPKTSPQPAQRPTRQSANSYRQQRAAGRARARRRMQITIAGAVVVLILAAAIFARSLTSQASAPSGAGFHPFISHPKQTLVAGQPIGGVGCGPTEGQTQHIHQHLDIVINGKIYAQPPYVGFIPAKSCLYWIHVHNDAPGGIHVEAPVSDRFVFGHFLDIWSISPVDQTYLKYIEGHTPSLVLVDGAPYGGDIRNIILGYHTLITLEYGTPHIAQPSFDFTQIEGTSMPAN